MRAYKGILGILELGGMARIAEVGFVTSFSFVIYWTAYKKKKKVQKQGRSFLKLDYSVTDKIKYLLLNKNDVWLPGQKQKRNNKGILF